YAIYQIKRPVAADLPVLVRELKDPDAKVRARAAALLAALGPDAKAATPELLEALKDSDADVRCGVLEAVSGGWFVEERGPHVEAAIAVIVEGLRDADIKVRHCSARAVGFSWLADE